MLAKASIHDFLPNRKSGNRLAYAHPVIPAKAGIHFIYSAPLAQLDRARDF